MHISPNLFPFFKCVFHHHLLLLSAFFLMLLWFLTDKSPYQNNRFSLRLPLWVQLLAVRRRSDDTWLGSRTGRFEQNLVRFGWLRWGGLQEHPGLHRQYWGCCEEEEEQRVEFPATVPSVVLAGVGNLGESYEPEERDATEGPTILMKLRVCCHWNEEWRGEGCGKWKSRTKKNRAFW